MPKYLLLKHYRGGPEPHRPVPPMDQWAPEDVEAHMAFQHHVSELLERNGEYVDAQALAPARTWVRYGGPDAAPVTTDGPHPETSDLIAGWWIIDVDSHERAVELAAYASSEPGPGGEPLYEWIDVREIMWERTPTTAAAGWTSRPGSWTRAPCAPSSLACSRAWSGGARTSTPPRTRCRRRCWRRCGSGPSIRPATRARGWRPSGLGGSSTPAAARPPVTAARRGRTP